MSCGVAPRTTRRVGTSARRACGRRAGAGGARCRCCRGAVQRPVRRRPGTAAGAGATGAAVAGGRRSGGRPSRGLGRSRRHGRRSRRGAAAGAGFAARLGGGGLLLRRGLRLARSRRRLEHLATLRRLGRLASRCAQPGHQVLGHARRGGLARHAHLLQGRQQLLAGDREFLRQFVDPHTAPIRSFPSISLPTSSLAGPVRNALPSTPGPLGRLDARRVAVHVGATTRGVATPVDRRAVGPGDDAHERRTSAPARGTPRTCGRARDPTAVTPAPTPLRSRALGRAPGRGAPASTGASAASADRPRPGSFLGRSRSRRGGRGARLVADLGLRLDVDAPSGEPGREPGVLALLPDRERELVVGHDDHGRARALVDAHLLDLRRLQGVGDELGGVLADTARRRSSRRGARSRPCARASPSVRRRRPRGRPRARWRARRSSNGAPARGPPP